MEFLWEKNMFSELVAAIQLYKSFKTRLWCDSKYVAKQLEGIGPTMSLALVNAGMTSFQKIDEANPRELELIVNRHAPFGNHLKAAVRKLPQYDLSIEQAQACRADSASLLLRLELAGSREQQQAAAQPALPHQAVLLIGDLDDNVVFKWRVFDSQLQRQGVWCRSVEVKRASKGPEIAIHLISLEWVGIDIHTTYVPMYSGGFLEAKATPKPSVPQDNRRTPSAAKRTAGSMEDDQTKKSAKVGAAGRSCSHRCGDKAACGHKCCKVGTLAGEVEEEEADVGLPSLTYRPRGKQQLQEQQWQHQQQQWQQQQHRQHQQQQQWQHQQHQRQHQQHQQQWQQQQHQRQHQQWQHQQQQQQQRQQQQQQQRQQQQQHQLQLHRQQLQQLQLKQHNEQQQQLQARVPQPNQGQARKSQLQSLQHEQPEVQPPKMQQCASHWRRQGAGSEQSVQDQKSSLPDVSDSQADSSPVIPVQGKTNDEHGAALVPGRDDDWEDLNIFQEGREAGSFSDGDFSSENDWERSQEILMNNHTRNDNMNSGTAAAQQPCFYSAPGWTRDYGFPRRAQPTLAGSAKSSSSKTDVEPEPFIRGCSPRKPSNVACSLRSKTEQGNRDAGVEPKQETPSRQGDPWLAGARSALSIQAIVNEVHRTPEIGSLFEGIF